ncbi:hypothetical protein RISK_006669 [Rhodopirellula islandica]|uniref:Uncharacterized protein n=1 Tax=Rhodopirellula islandica TaxID=595434 RepID=A0A0J1B4H5_RHOIS|nr:hypothetical protein RISK_006669 [Rhodopirellula islandica]
MAASSLVNRSAFASQSSRLPSVCEMFARCLPNSGESGYLDS